MELTFGVVVIRAYKRYDGNHLHCIDHFQHSVVVNLSSSSFFFLYYIIIIVITLLIFFCIYNLIIISIIS